MSIRRQKMILGVLASSSTRERGEVLLEGGTHGKHHQGSFTLQEKLLCPQAVAEWLQVSVDWVQAHATRKEPRIRCIKVGKLIRFRKADVEEFISRATVLTERN